MSQEDLKQKLAQLHQDLHREGDVDPELKRLLETVDTDIQQMLETQPQSDRPADLTERLQAMDAAFAIKHPHLEPVLREIVHLLQRIGI